MAKIKIIIIDDEALIRRSIAKIIEQSLPECEVSAEAESAADGIKLIEKYNPDIIITDIYMNGMDGLDMLSKVSYSGKVIVITGFRNFEYAQRAISLDVYALLLKPIHRDELIKTINSAIDSIRGKKMPESEEETGKIHYELIALKNILCSALEDGDISSVRYCTDKIIQLINSSSNDRVFIKSYYNKLMQSLYNFRSDMNTAGGSESNYCENLRRMIDESDSAEELSEMFVMSVNSLISPGEALNYENTSKHVRRAIKYINENYKNEISLEDVANQVYLSTVHMSRLFKKETGKNLMDYVNMVRIEKAKALLDTHQYKIYEVAEMVGFKDNHYFSTMFKKYAHMTPTDYISSH